MSKEILPSVDLIRSLLNYDAATGKLYWKHRPESMFPNKRIFASWNSRFADKEAFTANSNGYLAGSVHERMLYAHRVAWAIYHGAWPDLEIDHINCNKKDNRIANLRQADRCENNHNIQKGIRNTSGLKGVRWLKSKRKWVAAITHRKQRIHLGLFTTSEAAYEAYCSAAKRLHGEFARTY